MTLSIREVSALFSADRLRLARTLRGETKRALATAAGVTAAALSQYELGQTRPRPAVVSRLALALGVPAPFFATPSQTALSAASVHFRSLRSTRQLERDRARAWIAIATEIVRAVERYVELPEFVPLLKDGESPEDAARSVRQAWGVPNGPIGDVVRLLESRGIVVTYHGELAASISAFSATSHPRPVVVLDPAHDRARARFDAAHELGHLVLHPEPDPGRKSEEEADRFAAEFLAPEQEIAPQLPTTASLHRYMQLKLHWGLSIHALLMRARRLGTLSDHAYQRAVRKLVAMHGRHGEPAPLGCAEEPFLLPRAIALLAQHGLTTAHLADELRFPEAWVHHFSSPFDEARQRLSITTDQVLESPPEPLCHGERG